MTEQPKDELKEKLFAAAASTGVSFEGVPYETLEAAFKLASTIVIETREAVLAVLQADPSDTQRILEASVRGTENIARAMLAQRSKP